MLADIDPDSPVQSIHVDGSWLFAIDGKTVAALTYDNGADYFQEGLARTVHGGKIGFVNEALDVVITPSWDFAFPFENGHAVICTGCQQVPEGEHQSIRGGHWGAIDRHGKVVIEPVYKRDELPALP